MYNILIILFLKIFNLYSYFYYLFMSYVSPLYIIFDINNNKNITLKYYLNLYKKDNGSYFIKKYDITGVNYYAFTGNLNEITYSLENIRINRKNIILYNKNEPIQINLELLDNYYKNSKNFKNPIIKLDVILYLLNIKCTHISFIQYNPFIKEIHQVNELFINNLYQ